MAGLVAWVKGPAETYYEEHNRALKIIIAMCRGLVDEDGKPLFMETDQPWKDMKVSCYRPMTVDYKNEIL